MDAEHSLRGCPLVGQNLDRYQEAERQPVSGIFMVYFFVAPLSVCVVTRLSAGRCRESTWLCPLVIGCAGWG